jgi:hypothetical protein
MKPIRCFAIPTKGTNSEAKLWPPSPRRRRHEPDERNTGEAKLQVMIDAIVKSVLADAEKRLRAELALTPVWQIVAAYQAVRREAK